VERQPDSLQPDDEDQLETAAGQRRQKARDVAGREHADAEELEAEHRIGHAPLDGDEHGQEDEAARKLPITHGLPQPCSRRRKAGWRM